MAEINLSIDQTLVDIDSALEQKKDNEKERHYLGFSVIGEPCWRKLYYSFRNAEKRKIKASGVRSIEDGFNQEDIMADRLRMLPYIELHTVDPQNFKKQIGFKLLNGHFRGHCDGIIKGVRAAPMAWHVWENKAVNEQKFKKLNKSIDEFGEKNALEKWDEIYFAQAQIYMHCAKVERHYLTVQTPGGRDYTSCRTEYNKKIAEDIIEKANSIIYGEFIPERMSQNRELYLCKWCEFQEICHDGSFCRVHCRTCMHFGPINDGKFFCHKNNKNLEKNKLMLNSCNDHLYNSNLIDAEVLHMEEDYIVYKKNNIEFKNSNCGNNSYSSNQLRNEIKSIDNFNENALDVKNNFEGKILNKKETEKKSWNKKEWD